MMYDETWLTAEEAKRLGFVDEIIEDYATATEEDEQFTVNDAVIPTGIFKNNAALRRMVRSVKMDNATLLSKVKAFFGKDGRAEELQAENDKLRAEIERLKSEIKTADEIYGLIADQLESGGSRVKGSREETRSASDEAINRVVDFANGRAKR